MTRPYVVTPAEQARVPFLRGILTRSLQAADLSFDDAYEVASAVRAQLQGKSEIEADELRERVAELLETRFGRAVADRYRSPSAVPATILVESRDGQSRPFSRGLHMRFLGASGLEPTEASRKVFEMLEARPLDFGHWSAHKLEALTHHHVRHGEAVAIGIGVGVSIGGLPVEGALVSVYKDGEVSAYAYTDFMGEVNLPIAGADRTGQSVGPQRAPVSHANGQHDANEGLSPALTVKGSRPLTDNRSFAFYT